MSRKKRRRRRSDYQPPGGQAAPKVRVKVAVADSDLDAAVRLIKPAILYADSVVLYSPVASMVDEVAGLARISSPAEQLVAALQIIQQVPEFREQAGLTDELTSQIATFASMDPRLLRSMGRATGAGDEVDSLLEKLGEVSEVWGGLEGAIEAAKIKMGGAELFEAIDRGAVKVASLYESTSGVREVVEATNAALGRAGDTGVLDEMFSGFLVRTLEMLEDDRSFPLLDANTSGLLRALEREGGTVDTTNRSTRGAEISAAAAFMGFLPHFHTLPVGEILDLRDELRKPLVRFRGAVASLSSAFRSRPIDRDFSREVEDVWRSTVDPALSEIRETLAEHGLLQEVASVTLGDPRRLFAEAGGVLAASMGGVLPISELLVAALAAGLPAIDAVGRAVRDREEARGAVAHNSFYFLHRIDEEGRQHS